MGKSTGNPGDKQDDNQGVPDPAANSGRRGNYFCIIGQEFLKKPAATRNIGLYKILPAINQPVIP